MHEVIIAFFLSIIFAIVYLHPYCKNDRIARTESDMRSLQNSLESFFIDHHCYPETAYTFRLADAYQIVDNKYHSLTTPVAYISIPRDPFHESGKPPTYRYYSDGKSWFALVSNGPDRDEDLGYDLISVVLNSNQKPALSDFTRIIYDPSNGILSNGDVIRVSP